MSLSHSPQIVTNGLVRYLDAANTKSYPGSGTTWFDLSTSKTNGTLTNGPTFNSTNGGIFAFDGTDDHVSLGTPITSPLTECTVEVVFRSSIAGNSNTGYLIWDHSAGSAMWLGKSASNEWYWFFNYASARGKSARISATSYVPNTWIHLSTRFYISNAQTLSDTGNFAETIVNGISYSTTHRNDNTSAINYPSGNIYLARRGVSINNGEIGATVADYSSVDIGSFKVYNRVLSRAEIAQNFNALRGRFGI